MNADRHFWHPRATARRSRGYCALSVWQRGGQHLPASHPLTRAACYEASARDLEQLADAAVTALERRTWQLAAFRERVNAMRIILATLARAV